MILSHETSIMRFEPKCTFFIVIKKDAYKSTSHTDELYFDKTQDIFFNKDEERVSDDLHLNLLLMSCVYE